MSEEPISRQLEALEAIAEKGEAWLAPGWRGAHSVSIDYRLISARVWERLLDRGDLEIFEKESKTQAPSFCRYLRISEQGAARLAASGSSAERSL